VGALALGVPVESPTAPGLLLDSGHGPAPALFGLHVGVAGNESQAPAPTQSWRHRRTKSKLLSALCRYSGDREK
jgi:hypothetical protein